ncbi:hypothetical protein DPMN_039670 [Dreissena polymorpha]|uniref:Uncharacterized protein n=1 Tax=Dreissena polymorpha TaxID=45954 RepID=A0A9D4CUJ9_DREPO|nr:hypothetical protein DPMN_039670 [Dreissena polymorpha]
MVSNQYVDPNKVIVIQEKTQFNLRTNTDRTNCSITGICEIAYGNLVISDFSNLCVKLLDQAYTVIDQVNLPTRPWSMCNISSDEVAVTICDHKSLNEMHFLRMDTGKLNTIKHKQLNHRCYEITHHKGYMCVTSGTALLQYTTDGRLLKKLYEDESSNLADK